MYSIPRNANITFFFKLIYCITWIQGSSGPDGSDGDAGVRGSDVSIEL